MVNSHDAPHHYETGERGISREMPYKLMWALDITAAQLFEPPDSRARDANPPADATPSAASASI